MGFVYHLGKQLNNCWHKSAFYLLSITVDLYKVTAGTPRRAVQGCPRSGLPTCVFQPSVIAPASPLTVPCRRCADSLCCAGCSWGEGPPPPPLSVSCPLPRLSSSQPHAFLPLQACGCSLLFSLHDLYMPLNYHLAFPTLLVLFDVCFCPWSSQCLAHSACLVKCLHGFLMPEISKEKSLSFFFFFFVGYPTWSQWLPM